MSVHPDYLANAFTAIRADHGSTAAYADAVLGVTPAMQARLAGRFVT